MSYTVTPPPDQTGVTFHAQKSLNPPHPIDTKIQDIAHPLFEDPSPSSSTSETLKKHISSTKEEHLSASDHTHVLEELQSVDRSDQEEVKKAISGLWGYNIEADSNSEPPIGERFVVASHKVEVIPEANLMVIDMVPPERKEEVVASVRKTIAQDHTADEQVQQTAASGDVIALTPEESDELEELSMEPTYDWHSETVQGPSSPPEKNTGPTTQSIAPHKQQAEEYTSPIPQQTVTPNIGEEGFVIESVEHSGQATHAEEGYEEHEGSVTMRQSTLSPTSYITADIEVEESEKDTDELIEKAIRVGGSHEEFQEFLRIRQDKMKQRRKTASPEQLIEVAVTEKEFIDGATEIFGVTIDSPFEYVGIHNKTFAFIPGEDSWDALEPVDDSDSMYAMLTQSLNPANPKHNSLLTAVKAKKIRTHTRAILAKAKKDAKKEFKQAMHEFYLFVIERRAKEERKRLQQDQTRSAKSTAGKRMFNQKMILPSALVTTSAAKIRQQLERQKEDRKANQENLRTRHQHAIEAEEDFLKDLRANQLKIISAQRLLRKEADRTEEALKDIAKKPPGAVF